jgi:hypothetical protein
MPNTLQAILYTPCRTTLVTDKYPIQPMAEISGFLVYHQLRKVPPLDPNFMNIRSVSAAPFTAS